MLTFFREQEVEQLSLSYVHGGEAAAVWERLGMRAVLVIANATLDDVASNL